ncbi:hypothetical protein MTO96_047155, partial [Rhipicephalus appendiculatus]
MVPKPNGNRLNDANLIDSRCRAVTPEPLAKSSRLPTDPWDGYSDDASASARNWMPSRKKGKASYENHSCHRH